MLCQWESPFLSREHGVESRCPPQRSGSSTCFSKAVLIFLESHKARDGPAAGMDNLVTCLPALPSQAAQHTGMRCMLPLITCSLRGEEPMCYSKLENFMASLGNGYQFQGPSKGENAAISCGFWWEDEFHSSSSQEAWNSSVMKNRALSLLYWRYPLKTQSVQVGNDTWTYRTQTVTSTGHNTRQFSLCWEVFSYSRFHPPLIWSDLSLYLFLSITSAGSHLTWHKESKAWEPPAHSLSGQRREASTSMGRVVTPSPHPPVPVGHVPQEGMGYWWGCWSLHWPQTSSSGQAPGSAAGIIAGRWDGDGVQLSKDFIVLRLEGSN